MTVFNSGLKLAGAISSESYYEIEPEKELTEAEIKILEALEQLNASKAETNQGFNKAETKHFAQAYKPIAPPKDYEPKTNNTLENSTPGHYKEYDSLAHSRVNKQKLTAFDKVNDLVKKQQEDNANTKSTMHYDLPGRTHEYLPTPVYLCENNGQIIINITVNAEGNVIDTDVNKISKSLNQCLIEHALEYSKNARFNDAPSKPKQLGSITFYFIGKN